MSNAVIGQVPGDNVELLGGRFITCHMVSIGHS